MKKLAIESIMLVAVIGCSATSPVDPQSVPVQGGLRPIAQITGTYPHTAKGMSDLDHGKYIELQLLQEINPRWSFGLSSGHYRVDTHIDIEVMPGVTYTYSDVLEGAPIFFRVERGGYSRTGLLRYYFTLAAGYMFYGEAPDPLVQAEMPENGPVASTSIGMEILGRQGIDIRLEWGHFWEFDKRYDQWMGGLGVSYAF